MIQHEFEELLEQFSQDEETDCVQGVIQEMRTNLAAQRIVLRFFC